MIAEFRCSVNEVSAFLGYYTVLTGSTLEGGTDMLHRNVRY